jgi:hypothetical protein
MIARLLRLAPFAAVLAAAAACLPAHAGGVNWSVGISAPIAPGVAIGIGAGHPGYRYGYGYVRPAPVVYAPAPVYLPPPVVYAPPPPVYAAPVVYAPRPLYVAPRPVIYGPPVVVRPGYHHHHHRRAPVYGPVAQVRGDVVIR